MKNLCILLTLTAACRKEAREPADSALDSAPRHSGETGSPPDTEPPPDSEQGGESASDTSPPDTEPGESGDTAPSYPVELTVNEFMANNQGSLTDETGVFPDWIELYNLSDQEIPLAGYWMTDDLSEPDRHVLGEGLSLPPGGFLLLYADGRPELGPEHLGFELEDAGEEVGIYDPSGMPINLLSFGQQYGDLAAAREPDGGTAWTYTYAGTPGSTNTPPEPEPVTLQASGAAWRYWTGASAPEGDWWLAGYDDSGWSEGAAPLGYGDSHQITVIDYGEDPNNKYITSYFRLSFEVKDAASLVEASLSLMCDDGAVVYLNGVEVLRYNLPEGIVGWETLATASVGDAAEYSFYSFSIDPAAILSGSNQLAVEIHQSASTSSDLSFDLAVEGGEYPSESEG